LVDEKARNWSCRRDARDTKAIFSARSRTCEVPLDQLLMSKEQGRPNHKEKSHDDEEEKREERPEMPKSSPRFAPTPLPAKRPPSDRISEMM